MIHKRGMPDEYHFLTYEQIEAAYRPLAEELEMYLPHLRRGQAYGPFHLRRTCIKPFLEQKKINFMLGRRSTEEIDGYPDFIFLAKTGRPLMPSAVNNVIYNVVDKYNKEEVAKAKKEYRKADLLPRISAHNLRHTACANMAKQGMNVKVLQYIMGHTLTVM